MCGSIEVFLNLENRDVFHFLRKSDTKVIIKKYLDVLNRNMVVGKVEVFQYMFGRASP